MKRLTKYTIPETGFSVVSEEKYKRIMMEEKPSVEKVYNRLKKVEDILGDEYDLDELMEMVEAKREGRCVVLPVKPGTPVWSTAFCKVDDDGTEHPTYPWPFDIGMANEWGTEWFLTQEEAEAALRREQDGNRI